MTTSNVDIQRLIDRFMSGHTSLGEEELLAQYFRTHDVPEEWADYKAMFAYFDAGMPASEAATTPRRKAVALTPRWRKAARWAAAAVVMAAAGLTALYLGNTDDGIAPVQRNVAAARQKTATEATPISTATGVSATAAAGAPLIAQAAKPAVQRSSRGADTLADDGSNSMGAITSDGIAEFNEMMVAAEYDQWMARLQSDINTEQAMALIEQGAAVAMMCKSDGSDTDGAVEVP